MKKIFNTYIYLIIAVMFCLSPFTNLILAVQSDSVNVSLKVDSTCGNGVCNSSNYEDSINCPQDCGCNNNGTCESERGENSLNCPNDCLAEEEEEAPQEQGGPSVIPDTKAPLIFNVSVESITDDSAKILWETDEQALCQIYLGRTFQYEEIMVSEQSFYWKHSVKIAELISGTDYYFKIVCKDTSSNQSESSAHKFTTLFPAIILDDIPPANIDNFTAVPSDRAITLNWNNPLDPDFSGVVIVRSDKFYPSEISEGEKIYDGIGTSFKDQGLENGIRYYYTAFSYDSSGNYSSGAIVSEVPLSPLEPGEIPPEIIPPPELIEPITPPPPEIERIKIEDFNFFIQGKKVSIDKGMIELKEQEQLSVGIDYNKVPEVLKTILITIEKENKLFSFLLKINKDKTAYEAVIQAPKEPGTYPVTITILDYMNQTLKRIKWELKVEGVQAAIIRSSGPLYKNPFLWKIILYLLIIITAILTIRYFIKKIKEARERSKRPQVVYPYIK
ncbi:MAG: hypothetical protein PHI53_02265 [Candidatus Pacebacteria bacterium]|nr:hypothetical protein [Candidatus Paceibacterota bacterium]